MAGAEGSAARWVAVAALALLLAITAGLLLGVVDLPRAPARDARAPASRAQPHTAVGARGRDEAVDAEAAPRTVLPAADDGLLLRLVDPETRRGVPHTPVWLLDAQHRLASTRHGDLRARAQYRHDPGGLFREHGIVLETDADGYARWQHDGTAELIAWAERGSWCVQRQLDARALRASDDVVELVLQPDVHIHLHVLDPAGQAIEGAEVSWEIRSSDGSSFTPRHDQAPTTASGVEVRHLALALDERLPGAQLRARAWIPGAPEAVAPPVVLAPGEVHVQMTLPFVARVELRWLDAGGGPLRQVGFAWLRLAGDLQPWLSRPLEVGRASFPVVPGARYAVTLAPCFPRSCRWELDAPTRAGATATEVLRLPADTAQLSWRLVDPAGTPLRGEHIRLEILDGDGRPGHSATLETDEEGRTQVVVPAAVTNRPLDRAGLYRAFAQDGYRADLRPSAPWTAGAHDLGDIVLAPPLLLASGTVRGIAPPDTSGMRLRVRWRDDGVWRGELVDVRWSDTRFEIHGRPPAGELQLRAEPARGESAASAWVPFEPGARDLVVALPPGFAIDVPVRGLAGARLSITARAVPLEGPALAANEIPRLAWERTRTSEDPTLHVLRLARLPAGSYRIEVACGASSQPIVAGEAVQVGPGATPRLPPVELAEHLRRVCVQVVTPDGAPVPSGQVRAAQATSPIREGVATVWLDGPRAVEVRVPGHRVVRVPDVFADTVVTVEPE